ncbi:MAG: nuclear transport factor 2 family protein [Sphingobacterium sp.]|jgi:ketosteroid isomerase-like protein|nr:nuclear transport factor 2 family protein [Sphingobacterium sp.]
MDNSNHPNLILIHRFFEAYASNNVEHLSDVFHSDVKWHIPGNHPLSGTKVGVAGIVDYLAKIGEYNFQAEGIVMGVSDDHVIDCHRNWSNEGDGVSLNNMSCLLWKIENNKIKEVFNFPQDQHVVDAYFNSKFKK